MFCGESEHRCTAACIPYVDHAGKIDVEDWLGCSLVEHSLHVALISYEVLSAVHDLLAW